MRLAVIVAALTRGQGQQHLRRLRRLAISSATIAVSASFVPEGASATSTPAGELAAVSTALTASCQDGSFTTLVQKAAFAAGNDVLQAASVPSAGGIGDFFYTLVTKSAPPTGQPSGVPTSHPSLQVFTIPPFYTHSIVLLALGLGLGLSGMIFATYCAVTRLARRLRVIKPASETSVVLSACKTALSARPLASIVPQSSDLESPRRSVPTSATQSFLLGILSPRFSSRRVQPSLLDASHLLMLGGNESFDWLCVGPDEASASVPPPGGNQELTLSLRHGTFATLPDVDDVPGFGDIPDLGDDNAVDAPRSGCKLRQIADLNMDELEALMTSVLRRV